MPLGRGDADRHPGPGEGWFGPEMARETQGTVILVAQTCPTRAGSRPAPPEMGEEAS